MNFNSNHHSNFIDISKIKRIDTFVTEKIKPQYINEFVSTTLTKNKIIFDDNTYFWYKFIENSKRYEIYTLQTSSNRFITPPQILNNFYDKTKEKGIDLFILKDFFALYKYGKMYCFKSFTNSSYEDIKIYVEQTYNLSLTNTYTIDNTQFEELKNLYNQNNINQPNSNFIKLKKNNTFMFFNIFIILCILIFSYITYTKFNHLSNNSKQELSSIKKKYNKLKEQSKTSLTKTNHKKITQKLIAIFKSIKSENLTTKDIVYLKNKVKLSLQHKNKHKLLNFLTIYKKNITIEKIEFLEKKDIYNMVVSIAI
jgi:hypothetical protein